MLKKLGTGDTGYFRPCTSRQFPGWGKDEAGFTLLELLVVLVILIIAMSAFPLALDRSLPARRVHAATEHLEAAVHRAEVLSIALGLPQRVSIAEMTSQFATSTHLQANGPGGGPLRVLVTYPDGSTNGASFVVSDGRDRSTMAVSEITGRITVDTQ